MRLTLDPPAGFSFKRTVCSHGWSALAPFRLDVDRGTLSAVVAAPDGSRAFPTPHALACAGARALRERCRTGYRAPALAKLARDVDRSRLDPEGWERDGREPEELRKELLQLPGVGPYVAESLLRLFGRPAGLGLDSAVRSWYAQVYHGGRPVRDRTIARRYARLGRWAGLAVWCEMVRAWLDEVEPE